MINIVVGAIKKLKEFFGFGGEEVKVSSSIENKIDKETERKRQQEIKRDRNRKNANFVVTTPEQFRKSTQMSRKPILGQRANGGPVTGGASFLVGEKGPEIFTPGTDGMIGNGKGQIIININADPLDINRVGEEVVKVLNQQGLSTTGS